MITALLIAFGILVVWPGIWATIAVLIYKHGSPVRVQFGWKKHRPAYAGEIE